MADRLDQLEADLDAMRRGDFKMPAKGFQVGGVRLLVRVVGGVYRFYQQAPDGTLTDLTGGVVGAVDHAVLANLAYAASGHTGFATSGHGHTVYLLADGTRPLTANWAAGAFEITTNKAKMEHQKFTPDTDYPASYFAAAGASVLIGFDTDDYFLFVKATNVWSLFLSAASRFQVTPSQANINVPLGLGGKITMGGYDIEEIGVLQIKEQAAAEADVAGRGQIWVKTVTPNELWFTDDAGTDTQLGAIASATLAGKVELATTAEIDTGTDSTRAMPVDQFVASNRNIRYVTIRLVEAGTEVAVDTTVGGDWVCPFTGTLLQSDSKKNRCSANTDTAGTTGTMVVDVHKGGTTVMTTNKLDIETTEKSTNTATTQPDLTTTAVTEGDVFTFDVDAIHTTPAKGLSVTLAIREA